MPTNKLKMYFGISIIFFILHGLEEYLTGFYDSYPLLNFGWTNTVFQSIPQATFFTFQLMWWVILLVTFVLLQKKKGTLILMTFIGSIYIYEATHILSAILLQRYTPGLITAPLLPFVGFFYWKELLNSWRKKL